MPTFHRKRGSPASAPPARSGKAATKEAKPTARILLVDDELDILRSTQMLLGTMGYECIVLPDPAAIADVAEQERPNVILQDLVMPGLDLEATVAQLRARPATAAIPVVLYSASSDVSERAAQLDLAGYLTKPFQENSLREVIERALAQAAEPEGLEAAPAPEAKPPEPGEDRAAQKKAVQDYFHTYWNTITALNNYAMYLCGRPNISEAEKQACQEMQRLILELEQRTDLLRQKMLEVL